MVVIGIDLSGGEKTPTGLCILKGNEVTTKIVYEDRHIIEQIEEAELIGVDAPLSLPFGRCCLKDDCGCSHGAHFRGCDLELRKMKIKFFPITLGPMRKLTTRGIWLKEVLEQKGFRVIETYPGGVQDIWGIPRQKNAEGLRRGLKRFNLKGDLEKISRHELDAITCALVAQLHLQGCTISIGNPGEGLIILPRLGDGVGGCNIVIV